MTRKAEHEPFEGKIQSIRKFERQTTANAKIRGDFVIVGSHVKSIQGSSSFAGIQSVEWDWTEQDFSEAI